MAILFDSIHDCKKCGNKEFTKIEPFGIEIQEDKQKNIVYKMIKIPGTHIQCTSCKEVTIINNLTE